MQRLIQVLRVLRGGSQANLGQAIGVGEAMVYRYEAGLSTPPPKRLARIADEAGVPLPMVETVLLPVIRLALTRGCPREEALHSLEVAAEATENNLSSAVRLVLAPLILELSAKAAALKRKSSEEERLSLQDLGRRLEACTGRERQVLIKGFAEFQTPQLSVHLCAESARVAGHSAEAALDLASLALEVAEHAAGKPSQRSRIQGYACAFIGNAYRVRGNLPAADAAFLDAWRLWREGIGAEGIVSAWRLHDLEASLRRAQRRWREALELHDKARAMAPIESLAHVFLNQALTLEQAERIEDAIAVLQEAAPLLDAATGEDRLRFALHFNLATNLCHLSRWAEAEELLPEIRHLAEALGNELDLIRVQWLAGRIAAGLGRKEEAYAALDLVREEFAALGIGYDAALVSLELAAILLEQRGPTAKVLHLAEEMVRIFESQKVHREALAALGLFCRAIEERTATVKMVRRLLRYLERARHDPGLHFEHLA